MNRIPNAGQFWIYKTTIKITESRGWRKMFSVTNCTDWFDKLKKLYCKNVTDHKNLIYKKHQDELQKLVLFAVKYLLQ